jgi:hypothetical protein
MEFLFIDELTECDAMTLNRLSRMKDLRKDLRITEDCHLELIVNVKS